jgi:peptidoglycan hydrolase-like protein with peptidoglycan-binding domain
MHPFKSPLLCSLLLALSLLFGGTSLAAPALAATKGTASPASARTSTTHAFSPLAASTACSQSCSINACPPSQSENNSGNITEWVKMIQFRLNWIHDAGTVPNRPDPVSWPLATDGSFGSETLHAVINFQDFMGITGGNGVVGDRTWSAMGFCLGFQIVGNLWILGTGGSTCPPSQSMGGNNDSVLVQAIQDALNLDYQDGFFHNSPNDFDPYLASDGSFGQLTKNAVLDFQAREGITNGGGVVGQRTWSDFGLCY